MYEAHSDVSLKAAVKELGTDLGSRGVGWEGVGKLGGKGLDSGQGESGCVRVRVSDGLCVGSQPA